MSALGRLYLLVTLLFALVTCVALVLLARQAGADVQRELQAAEAVVDYLYTSAQRDPQSLHPDLTANLRHIRVQWLRADEHALPGAPSFEQWLTQRVFAVQVRSRELRLADGRVLRISVDPRDEVEEVGDSLLQLLGLSLLALLLSLLTIHWALQRGLRVLDELLRGLQQVSQGQLDTRLPLHSVREARRLSRHFNNMATTLQQVQADNDELTQALMALQERERARLGQTLHDDLGQYLSGIRAQACLLRMIADDPQQVRATAAQLELHSQRLQDGFRALIRDLYPVMLEHLELDEALQLLSHDWQDSTGVACVLHSSQQQPRLALPTKAQLYRLIQEALTNVARHANASRVQVRLHYQGRRLRLLIRDNGCGAQLPQRPGIGLRSMQERARSIGAQLRLHSRPGAGWALWLSLPISNDY
ncbi:histidine kinase [Pseudomonas sp. 5P_3.1_Bac2]|uniref:HAMP domain-containing sensor histidine kinase n=1 Tax=Pseudomonas sp. 5P_3.1_Bac2 TaxID=2971617 RepID=UPI0021C8FEF4|nr:histidine kinase [Pseudomonas sp. 5P_3.1_Bac2]MCU1716828.1 histidine kinase [Pseudomonas sp. 5P_3.1_Bac2]